METIKILRMKSGYDVIGFVSEENHQIHIKKPMKIGIQVDPRDQQQFFVIQNWLPHQYLVLSFPQKGSKFSLRNLPLPTHGYFLPKKYIGAMGILCNQIVSFSFFILQFSLTCLVRVDFEL